MKNITESYLKERLKNAVEQILPDKAEEIWAQPVEKASGDEWFLDGLDRHVHTAAKVIKIVSAAAACFVIGMFSYYMIVLQSQATVYLDVNPSIQFELNSREEVISAEAANQDGEIILEDMDLKHTDLDVAVNAIFGSMVKHGYLSQAENMVLLSVDSSNPNKSEKLRTEISKEISSCLDSMVGSASVFDQDVYVDDELKAMAEQYEITPGKAELIRKLTSENPKLNYAQLASLPIKDLVERLNQEGIDLREYANYTGNGYILEPEEEDDSEEPEKESNDKDQEDDRDTDSQDKEEEDDDSEEGRRQGALPLNGPSQRNEASVSSVSRPESEEPEYEAPEPEEPAYEVPEPEYEEPEYEEPEYEEPEADDDGEEDD
ncbi:anti-sigma-I factor RsgI family protein [Blautia sp.]|jgi:hypothetical protein|uniref:anti-sigma-I factor RsgI family protein n=1 Tax=Blautia sp. TaxID=1955243 RepID=UPI00280B1B78|nr:hypothetical protein [Blautia sp.]MED9882023.1 hypothetical protein [Blautia sp.]